ncbi:MAG: UDP-N-acetylglucosamine diphosphorylase [Anaerolineae bacterium]
MPNLSVKHFFNLDHFAHAALFDGCVFVWEALKNLASYFDSSSLGRIETDLPSQVYVVDKERISIGEGTIIEPGAYLQGPCIIGKNCLIRHGAYIRGSIITGNDCVIGHDTEVKASILLDGARAPHFNYVGDSILGNRANLGAGVKCANLRLDNALITVRLKDQTVSTGLKKLGAIIGDNSELGCNCVTNPGTILGPQVLCFPCLNIGGFVPPRSIVKPSQKSVIENV